MVGTRERQSITRNTHRPPTPKELYANLPQQAKWDLQERSSKQSVHDDNRRKRRRSQLIQSMVEGVSLYLPLEMLLYGISLLSAAVTIVVGLLLGCVWHKLTPIPSVAGLTAIGGFLVVRIICGMGFTFNAIISMLLITCLSFAIWITRASERMGV